MSASAIRKAEGFGITTNGDLQAVLGEYASPKRYALEILHGEITRGVPLTTFSRNAQAEYRNFLGKVEDRFLTRIQKSQPALASVTALSPAVEKKLASGTATLKAGQALEQRRFDKAWAEKERAFEKNFAKTPEGRALKSLQSRGILNDGDHALLASAGKKRAEFATSRETAQAALTLRHERESNTLRARAMLADLPMPAKKPAVSAAKPAPEPVRTAAAAAPVLSPRTVYITIDLPVTKSQPAPARSAPSAPKVTSPAVARAESASLSPRRFVITDEPRIPGQENTASVSAPVVGTKTWSKPTIVKGIEAKTGPAIGEKDYHKRLRRALNDWLSNQDVSKKTMVCDRDGNEYDARKIEVHVHRDPKSRTLRADIFLMAFKPGADTAEAQDKIVATMKGLPPFSSASREPLKVFVATGI